MCTRIFSPYEGQAITYDAIGNPLEYRDGTTLTWSMRDLKTVSKSGLSASYNYNADGFRVSKTVKGVTAQFVLDDSGNILKQTSGSNTLLFLYDDNGGRVGLQYNGANYLYVYNAQGDVIAIVDSNHNVVVSYTYDEWGNKVSVTGTMASTLGTLNPFRYRGYCYDEETGWYYLQSRYYDPVVGRFISADSQINYSVLGANLFAYCENNPVNMVDPIGNEPIYVEYGPRDINTDRTYFIRGETTTFTRPVSGNLDDAYAVKTAKLYADKRPYTGEPGSTYEGPNGDKRTYGPDGLPERDYDNSDHGRPDKHPHDNNGGHNHDWENGVRGPAYTVNWGTVGGVALVTVCVIGIVIVATDDITGIGIADDFLFGPLGAGVGQGMVMIFG